MLKWIVAAVLAVMALPAQAATMVRFQAIGPASGIYQLGVGVDPVEYTGTIYVDAWMPAESVMGYWCTPPLVCSYSGNTVIGRDENPDHYGSFQLVFDHLLGGMPQSADGFLGGTAAGGVAGLPPSGTGNGQGTLTNLTVSVYSEGYGPSINVWTVPNAVPEPATWLMLIAGFGLVGWALRSRPALNQVMNL
jgi:hypothetical protein